VQFLLKNCEFEFKEFLAPLARHFSCAHEMYQSREYQQYLAYMKNSYSTVKLSPDHYVDLKASARQKHKGARDGWCEERKRYHS
jgi:hypothetical protein